MLNFYICVCVCVCVCVCRDLLQTLTQDELHTLERSLCISSEGECPSSTPPPPRSPDAQAPQAGHASAEGSSQWEEAGVALLGQREEEEEEEAEPTLCEEDEAELACSMQYDEEEFEQLSMLVHRLGNHMTSLLSPPSQGQSPAHSSTQPSSAGSSTHPSPSCGPSPLQEHERVFFMDDLEGGGATGTITNEDELRVGPAPRPSPNHTPGPPTLCNGWSRPRPTEEGFTPSSNGWGGRGVGAEPAEVIAHRTGGMKLSATVIFNPVNQSERTLVLPRPSEAESCGGSVGLLHSCVCCAGCQDVHDSISLETAAMATLGLSLGLDKRRSGGKGDIKLTPPSPRCSAEHTPHTPHTHTGGEHTPHTPHTLTSGEHTPHTHTSGEQSPHTHTRGEHTPHTPHTPTSGEHTPHTHRGEEHTPHTHTGEEHTLPAQAVGELSPTVAPGSEQESAVTSCRSGEITPQETHREIKRSSRYVCV